MSLTNTIKNGAVFYAKSAPDVKRFCDLKSDHLAIGAASRYNARFQGGNHNGKKQRLLAFFCIFRRAWRK
ncbi:hypothetical protein LMJ53_13195 [Rheinheimera sp. UJ51]|uniref:hypothetical protein n=1 Tax=unclassified Rheinheimera TaxID=115860 RepID=UPI001E559CEF|nr:MULTISPECIES: hypothetical protein [unclassified Rheinheimera]MCC5452677.1 hypothetical protein [Rheinheimera sp. UJ51]MCF4010407.1 hypothetical protein [Rheinheimera sp. UJ63]